MDETDKGRLMTTIGVSRCVCVCVWAILLGNLHGLGRNNRKLLGLLE